MQCTFNSQERTLREIATLCRSAGWKVTKVVKAPGSLFGHITAVPTTLPKSLPSPVYRAKKTSADLHVLDGMTSVGEDIPFPSMYTRSATPTFGTNVGLRSYEETKARSGVKLERLRGIGKKAVGRLRRMTISKEKEKIGPSPLASAIELDPRTTKISTLKKHQSTHSFRHPLRPSVDLGDASLSETVSVYPPGPSSPRFPVGREHNHQKNASSMTNVSLSTQSDVTTSNFPTKSSPGESHFSVASFSQPSPYVSSDLNSPGNTPSPRRRRRRADTLVGLGSSFIRSLSFGTGGVVSVERAAEFDVSSNQGYSVDQSAGSMSFSSLGSAFHISSSSSRGSERSNGPPSPISPRANSGLRYASSMLDLSADPFSRETSTVGDSDANGGSPRHQRKRSVTSQIGDIGASEDAPSSSVSLPVPSPRRKRGDTVV